MAWMCVMLVLLATFTGSSWAIRAKVSNVMDINELAGKRHQADARSGLAPHTFAHKRGGAEEDKTNTMIANPPAEDQMNLVAKQLDAMMAKPQFQENLRRFEKRLEAHPHIMQRHDKLRSLMASRNLQEQGGSPSLLQVSRSGSPWKALAALLLTAAPANAIWPFTKRNTNDARQATQANLSNNNDLYEPSAPYNSGLDLSGVNNRSGVNNYDALSNSSLADRAHEPEKPHEELNLGSDEVMSQWVDEAIGRMGPYELDEIVDWMKEVQEELVNEDDPERKSSARQLHNDIDEFLLEPDKEGLSKLVERSMEALEVDFDEAMDDDVPPLQETAVSDTRSNDDVPPLQETAEADTRIELLKRIAIILAILR